MDGHDILDTMIRILFLHSSSHSITELLLASTQVKEEKFGKLAAAVASLTWPPQSLSTIVMVGAKAPPSGALHC